MTQHAPKVEDAASLAAKHELEADPFETAAPLQDETEQLRAVEQQLRTEEEASAADERPTIQIRTEEHAVVDLALEALAADPVIYQVHGVGLVHVLRDSGKQLAETGYGRPRGAPRIGVLPKATLRERLTAIARWESYSRKEKDWIGAHPPTWAVDAIHARGTWPGIRRLEGIIEVPALRSDGSMVDAPGYDARTGLLYEPTCKVPPVPRRPTREDAARALEELSEVVIDFPFVGPEHRAAWLASLLTPIAAAGQEWPAPLFLFDANTRGSGKTLLADLVALLLTGRPMPRMTLSESTEEARKTLFALALGGEALAFFDEASVLRGPALNAALTGRVIKDRILGESRDATATMRATFYAAGNNVQVKGDTMRRVIHVRLESKEEHPEDRCDFRHPHLRDWLVSERPRLVRAALTVLRAHAVAGYPATIAPLGSFEGWSAAVRNPLIWAGAADPCKTRAALLAGDSEEALLRQLIAGWQEVAGEEAISVRDAVDRLQRSHTLRAAFEELGGHVAGELNTRSIGRRLGQYRDRWCGGRRLTGKPDRNGVVQWRTEVRGV